MGLLIKTLIREITIGQVRIQEIRQHILDLHYKKSHSKRIKQLILTNDQILSRQAAQQQALKNYLPTMDECKELTNEFGTGCYLSTMTLKEVVLDGEPLWICGQVMYCIYCIYDTYTVFAIGMQYILLIHL